MKSCRRGFIRWSRRDGPCGSHQVEARALKCETSVGLTEDVLDEDEVEDEAEEVNDPDGDAEEAEVELCARNWFWTNRGEDRSSRRRLRKAVGVGEAIGRVVMTQNGLRFEMVCGLSL